MKQANHSFHEKMSVKTRSDNAQRKENQRVKLFPFRRTQSMKIIFTAILFASIIVIYVLANRGSVYNDKETASIPISTDKIVEVEVVDGTGNIKIAQHMTNVLRTLGYDVVELKKSNEGIIERSYILDRSGNLDIAHRLATSLGIPKDKVFQKINHNLYLDITVVVGKDFSKFKAFQSFEKRNKR